MRRDILTAYLAAAARLVSWIIVTAIVYRRLGPPAFAILALTRTTIGLLNYTTLGLAPATVRFMTLEERVYSSAVALALLSGIGAAILACLYALLFSTIHILPQELSHTDLRPFVAAMGLGTVFRLMSDPLGAVLQVRGRISLDNLLLAGAELAWLAICLLPGLQLQSVGWAWFFSGLLLLLARSQQANQVMGRHAFSLSAISTASMNRLLAYGLLVALAQAADFLYAPTDNILINRLLNPVLVATYAPAIQIDAGVLLLVGALAAVLLPHSAIAIAGENRSRVKTFYVAGTLASIGLLSAAALSVWFFSDQIFRLWLHDSMPATRAILPLVLIHTVVGGSSAVGRSVLLAVGKAKPFTVAVLIAGAANVILSFIFVRYFHLGLPGIVYGTIVAVVARCAIWTPWYVLRSLRTNRRKFLL